jgi:purine-nucleoside phosphorylase
LRDVIIAMGASTDSNVNRARLQGYDYAAIADYNLLEASVKVARDANKQVRVGNVFSADLFYSPVDGIMETLANMNVLAVEMEAAGLYGVANEYGANALAMMTVSDHILRGEELSADERQTTFNDMVEITLDAALSF